MFKLNFFCNISFDIHCCVQFNKQLFQIETREDEEQSQKLSEIIDILIAAGYFRARIKGLSPFDKV